MRCIGVLVLLSIGSAAFAQLNIQPEIHALNEVAAGKYKASISYPVFKGDTAVVAFANTTLKARAAKLLAAFKQGAGPRGGNEALTKASISYYTTQIITGVMTSYTFTGGAHGNTVSLPYNFAIVGGSPKELRFSDVFRAGSQSEVSGRVLKKLSLVDRATYVGSGQVSAMTPEMLNRFVITKEGVKFLFDRYELAPYVNGDFNVTLLFSEIDDVLIPDGPASLIPR